MAYGFNQVWCAMKNSRSYVVQKFFERGRAPTCGRRALITGAEDSFWPIPAYHGWTATDPKQPFAICYPVAK
jgi:hypothetical protein